MSRALDKARAEVTRCEADVAKWQGKALARRSRLADLERSAGATLLDDPDAEGRLPAMIAAAAGEARAFDKAAGEAHGRLVAARRAVLLVEADDEDAAAVKAEREAASVAREVDDLLAQLEAVSGARYELPDEDRISRAVAMGERVEVPVPHTERLAGEALAHRIRAAVLRHTATHAVVPTFSIELGDACPAGIPPVQLTGGWMPESAREFAAFLTGATPVAAVAAA